MADVQSNGDDSYAIELRRLASQNISRPFNSSTGQKPLEYITYSQLRKLWKAAVIRGLLGRYPACENISVQTIQHGYLRVLSMLVWCGRVEELRVFTSQNLNDLKFPLRQLEVPEALSSNGHLRELFHTIVPLQWIFYPLFIHPLELGLAFEPVERILPILREEQIAKGEEATIFKSWLHPDCCDVEVAVPRREDGKVIAVRKVYSSKIAHRSMYDRERRAYQELRPCKSNHIVEYYGSFIHRQIDGTEIPSLLLEYVEGVNLDEFFSQAKPPRNKQELLNLWGGFEGLFEALHHIYNHKVTIAHQDISPFNLMVAGKPNLDKKLHIKVTDFGYSYTAAQGVSRGRVLNMMGGREYGAPQTCHDDPFLNRGPNAISPAVDVWSAGAIMSDTAAWIYGGQRAREEYDDLRLNEVKERPILDSIPYFHNGNVRLGVVDTFHRRITENLPEYDSEITRPILNLVELAMLPAVGGVANVHQPGEIKTHLNKMLESASKAGVEFGSGEVFESTDEDTGIWDSPRSPIDNPVDDLRPDSAPEAITPSPRENQPPARPDNRPHLSWLDAQKYYYGRKKTWAIDKKITEAVDTLTANLSGRDFVFLVDTSTSMKPHRESMKEFLLVYTYLVKKMDPDGLEVSYTSSGKFAKYKASAPVVKDFDKQTWTGFGFEDKFGSFISEMMARMRDWNPRRSMSFTLRKPKKQSIFVLTDGRWAGSKGIKNHIRTVIKEIQARGYGRTQFTIQFVSFGSDRADLERLEELDNFGREEGMDIVDTKPFNFDVYAVLYGAIDELLDGLGESAELGSPMSPTSTAG